MSFGEWLALLPCRILGHKWVEIPRSLRVSQWNPDPDRLFFKCSRCHMVAGFRNR